MFILLKSHHLGRLISSLEHLVLMALRHLLTPQTSFCSWPRIYTGSQRASSTVCVNADVMMTTCAFSKETPSCSIWWFFPTELFSLHQRAKGQKARKPTPFGTWRQNSWLKLWPCMPRKKCKACYYTSRNPSWKEITSAFISAGIHSKECTHFMLLSQHLIIYMQNDIWFCHQVGNFVVLLFLLKQMIATNSAESG